MKLTSLCSLYSKFNINPFIHNTLRKFDPEIIAPNKYLTNERSFNVVTARTGGLEQRINRQRILQNEQNSDDRSKDKFFLHHKYSSPYLHEMRIQKENVETVFSQFRNEYISKQLRKGVVMIPGIATSNRLNYLLQQDKMFLIYRIFGIQSKYYEILDQWANFCNVMCGYHQPLIQVESEGSISCLLHDTPDCCLSYSRFDNVLQNQETILSQNICTGKRYIHDNYQLLTAPKLTQQSGNKQNYSCRNCRKPLEMKAAAEIAEKENHDGLLTCKKGGQSAGGQDSSSDTGEQNDEGLLTCRRVAQVVEFEEKIKKAEKRQQLQGTWKDLCKRSQPTKDSITLARTAPWWRLINRLRGVSMDDRLQKYFGHSRSPFFRKSLADRRIELGVDSSKPVASWACKGKRKVKQPESKE